MNDLFCNGTEKVIVPFFFYIQAIFKCYSFTWSLTSENKRNNKDQYGWGNRSEPTSYEEKVYVQLVAYEDLLL